MSESNYENLKRVRARIERLAWLLDDSIPVPGTQRRFGLDPILGLIPGAGDLVGALLSLYVVGEAARLGTPQKLIWKMLGNVALEVVIGVIPVIGDLFDFVWKANSRNRQMLLEYIDQQLVPPSTRANWGWVLVVILLGFAMILFYSQSASGPV